MVNLVNDADSSRLQEILDDWSSWPFGLGTRPTIKHLIATTALQQKNCYCIQSDVGKFALRVADSAEARILHNTNSDEAAIHHCAAAANIAPDCFFHDSGRYSVCRWINTEATAVTEPTDAKNAALGGEKLRRVLQKIASYQALDVSSLKLADYDYLAALDGYIDRSDGTNSAASKEAAGAILCRDRAIDIVRDYQTRYGQQRCLSHNDLNPGNVLWQANDAGQARCWIIDWEFAGIGIASFDFASLVVEFQLDSKELLTAATNTGLSIDQDELALAIDCYRTICHYYQLSLT